MGIIEWLNDIEPDNTGIIPYLKNLSRIFVVVIMFIAIVFVISQFIQYLGFKIHIEIP